MKSLYTLEREFFPFLSPKLLQLCILRHTCNYIFPRLKPHFCHKLFPHCISLLGRRKCLLRRDGANDEVIVALACYHSTCTYINLSPMFTDNPILNSPGDL